MTENRLSVESDRMTPSPPNMEITGERLEPVKKQIEPKPILSNTSMESLRSKRSFGFVPSMRTIAPLSNRGKRSTQNFLILLDTLDALEDEEQKRRKPYTVASSSGIEANPSDETASQTCIGREPDNSKDPGQIQLSLIRAQEN